MALKWARCNSLTLRVDREMDPLFSCILSGQGKSSMLSAERSPQRTHHCSSQGWHSPAAKPRSTSCRRNIAVCIHSFRNLELLLWSMRLYVKPGWRVCFHAPEQSCQSSELHGCAFPWRLELPGANCWLPFLPCQSWSLVCPACSGL